MGVNTYLFLIITGYISRTGMKERDKKVKNDKLCFNRHLYGIDFISVYSTFIYKFAKR